MISKNFNIHTNAHKPSDNNKQKNVANNKLLMKQTQAIFTLPLTEAMHYDDYGKI